MKKLEERINGLEDSFGDSFKTTKMIVETQNIEQARLLITKQDGLILEIMNLYKIINPILSSENDSDETPCIEF